MAYGPQTARIVLTSEERGALTRWARQGRTAQALALRARIVLACADRPDVPHNQLAREFGVHRATVGVWRKRFAARRPTPTVAGRRPAVLLLPDPADRALTPDEWDAVVLHEIAHVRRGDYAANWGACLVAAACWFHPGVWLLARAAAEAREECCDADAVRTSRRPLVLARALVRLEESRQHARPTVRWGGAAMAASGGALTARVRRLLDAAGPAAAFGAAHARRRRGAARLVVVAGAAAILLGPLVAAATATVSQHLPVAAAHAGAVPARRVRIEAADPAGRFTVRLLNGRVAAAALDGRAAGRWEVRGGELVVRGAGGRVLLAVHVDPQGALRWEPRRGARSETSAGDHTR